MKTEEQIRQEIWQEFCAATRKRLSHILSPIVKNNSYNPTLWESVLTNILLFEINMDKSPWEQIPEAPIKIRTKKELLEDMFYADQSKVKDIAKLLMHKIRSDAGYNHESVDYISDSKFSAMGLYAALKTFIKDYDDTK